MEERPTSCTRVVLLLLGKGHARHAVVLFPVRPRPAASIRTSMCPSTAACPRSPFALVRPRRRRHLSSLLQNR
jgi:hypothetical protein